MVIIDPKTKEEDVEKLIKKVEKTIEKYGEGKIKEITNLGLRKLAYPINHKNEGLYYLLNLEVDPRAVKEYESVMKLSNIVLRFLTQRSTFSSTSTSTLSEKKEECKEEEYKEEEYVKEE